MAVCTSPAVLGPPLALGLSVNLITPESPCKPRALAVPGHRYTLPVRYSSCVRCAASTLASQQPTASNSGRQLDPDIQRRKVHVVKFSTVVAPTPPSTPTPTATLTNNMSEAEDLPSRQRKQAKVSAILRQGLHTAARVSTVLTCVSPEITYAR